MARGESWLLALALAALLLLFGWAHPEAFRRAETLPPVAREPPSRMEATCST